MSSLGRVEPKQRVASGEPQEDHGYSPVDTASVEEALDERSRRLVDGRRFGRIRRRGWLVRRALVSADIAGLLAAFLIAQFSFAQVAGTDNKVDPVTEFVAFTLTLPLWVLLARLFGLYSRDEEHADHTTVDDMTGVFTVVTVGSWLFFTLSWATGLADPYIPKLMLFWFAAIGLVTLGRAIARSVVRKRMMYLQNTIIIGAGKVGQLVASKVLRHPEYGINLLGFVDRRPTRRRDDLGDLPILGGPRDLRRLARDLHVERVIVAFSNERFDEFVVDLRALRGQDVQVDVVPRFFDLVGPGASFHAVEGLPLVGLPPARLPIFSLFLKRSLDIIGSSFGLLLLSPLFAYIALRIRLESPGPALFRQHRPGRAGELFTLYKFRTMCVSDERMAEAAPLDDTGLQEEYRRSFKLRDDPRVTPFGRRLRASSLDELPQLWNVLKGDMSLVGPRPMLLTEVGARGASAADTLAVKPGMTGLWQINGRSDTDYEDRLRLELSYVANWSLGLDLSILAKTMRVVVSEPYAY